MDQFAFTINDINRLIQICQYYDNSADGGADGSANIGTGIGALINNTIMSPVVDTDADFCIINNDGLESGNPCTVSNVKILYIGNLRRITMCFQYASFTIEYHSESQIASNDRYKDDWYYRSTSFNNGYSFKHRSSWFIVNNNSDDGNAIIPDPIKIYISDMDMITLLGNALRINIDNADKDTLLALVRKIHLATYFFNVAGDPNFTTDGNMDIVTRGDIITTSAYDYLLQICNRIMAECNKVYVVKNVCSFIDDFNYVAKDVTCDECHCDHAPMMSVRYYIVPYVCGRCDTSILHVHSFYCKLCDRVCCASCVGLTDNAMDDSMDDSMDDATDTIATNHADGDNGTSDHISLDNHVIAKLQCTNHHKLTKFATPYNIAPTPCSECATQITDEYVFTCDRCKYYICSACVLNKISFVSTIASPTYCTMKGCAVW